MNATIRRIYSKIMGEWSPKVEQYDNLITIGTAYGGWTIPDNYLNEHSIVYLAGAGEDISFDVGIVERFGSKVYIYDPTPRAKAHVNALINGIHRNERVPINNSKNVFYNIKKENLDKLIFKELGLWNKEQEIQFYAPKNPEHVSHSLLNLQKTGDYFWAKVDRLSNIMKTLGHDHIDLLKIDIEGAEYEVIDSILQDKIKIKILCVEFDEAYNPLDKAYLHRIKRSVSNLIEYGYKVVYAKPKHNYTFILSGECVE